MTRDRDWPSREDLLRHGIPDELRAAALQEARALRQAAIDAAFGRIGKRLRAAVAALVHAIAPARPWHG